MTPPNEKDRDAAREFECPSCKVHPHRQACTLSCEDARVADAHARGRDEAKAEAAQVTDAILAPASGPTYEERLRAEIAERVGAIPAFKDGSWRDAAELCNDILAIINGGVRSDRHRI